MNDYICMRVKKEQKKNRKRLVGEKHIAEDVAARSAIHRYIVNLNILLYLAKVEVFIVLVNVSIS